MKKYIFVLSIMFGIKLIASDFDMVNAIATSKDPGLRAANAKGLMFSYHEINNQLLKLALAEDPDNYYLSSKAIAIELLGERRATTDEILSGLIKNINYNPQGKPIEETPSPLGIDNYVSVIALIKIGSPSSAYLYNCLRNVNNDNFSPEKLNGNHATVIYLIDGYATSLERIKSNLTSKFDKELISRGKKLESLIEEIKKTRHSHIKLK